MSIRVPLTVRASLTVLALCACSSKSSGPAEGSAAAVADRGWAAHEAVVAAGEKAPTCAAAGIAMQAAFADRRQAFVDAMALDRDKARLAQATEYLEAHQDRYADLETRMEALAERCADDATVQAAFAQMSNP